MSIFAWVRGIQRGPWRHHHFIAEIRKLVRLTNASLHHIPLSQNDMADKVAKWSSG